MESANACCGHPFEPRRVFCPGCGKTQPGQLGVRISTEASRARALDEVDRACGIFDTDAQAERREREMIET